LSAIVGDQPHHDMHVQWATTADLTSAATPRPPIASAKGN
jgi:hypothetical protein